MSMRSKFTAPGLTIHYYVVEFDSDNLSWSDFRGKVLELVVYLASVATVCF